MGGRVIDIDLLRSEIGKQVEIIAVPDYASAPVRYVSDRNRVGKPRLIDCICLDDLWMVLDCMSDPASASEGIDS